ncbi:polyketide synthase, partial [Streptomyces hoynatensis]
MRSLAEAWVAGVPVEWGALFAGSGAVRVDLPTYAFDHQRYWPKPTEATKATTTADPVDAALWELIDGDQDRMAAALDLDGDTAALVAPALSAWRERRRARATVDSWRYGDSWAPLSEPETAEPAGRWLVVVPRGWKDDPWLRSVVAELGEELTLAEAPAPDRAALAESFAAYAGEDFAGVLSLAAFAQEEGEHPATDVPQGLALSLTVVQALTDAEVTGRVWWATRGAVSIGGNDRVIEPGLAVLWGMGRVAALEMPARWGGLLDLPVEFDARAGQRLRAVLYGESGEDQVAVRSSGVFGRRLVRLPVGVVKRPGGWVPSGTVLITGGTGGLGG